MTTDQDTVAPNRQLLARDADGLMLNQRRLLQEMAQVTDWRKACENAEIKPETARGWLTRDEAFIQAYNDLLGPAVEIARDLMESSALKAAGMYSEAIEAMKVIDTEVTCPHCRKEFTLESVTPDWNARLRAGDTILKSAKILKDVKEISGSITHLSMEESLALAKAKHAMRNGLPLNLPPSLMAKIRPYLEEVTA